MLPMEIEFTLGHGQKPMEWEKVRGQSKHADTLKMLINQKALKWDSPIYLDKESFLQRSLHVLGK